MQGFENVSFGIFKAKCFTERRAKLEEAKAVVKGNLNKELNRSTGMIEYTFKKGVMRWSWNGFKAKFASSMEYDNIKWLVEHLNFDNFKKFTEFAKSAKSEDVGLLYSGVKDEIETIIAKGRKKPKGNKEKIELLNLAFPMYLEKVKTPAPKTVYRAKSEDVDGVTDVEAKEIKTKPKKVVEKVAGVDYPMGVNLKGIWTFAWNGIIVKLEHAATEETVISVKEMSFEEFKAFAAKVNEPSPGQGPSTVEKPDTSVEVTKDGVPSMRVTNDGTYIFTWGEYTIEKPMDEVSVEFITKVMSSTYEVFAINAKVEASKEASVEEPVVTEEAAAPVDELKSALKEATASMSQEQPATQMAEALKKAASEDRKYEEGKTFKYQSVRRKR